MRILIVNWSIRRVGGIEDYLTNIIPELRSRGHVVAFAHEVDVPEARDRISLGAGTPVWDMSQLGMNRTLESMSAWEPDLIFSHGLLDTNFEAKFLNIAPAFYFSHNYYGTCISGLKTHTFPIVQPCSRRFGPACLMQYFPRRCGGRNPVTMFQLYRRETRRLANFSSYLGIVTHSTHMRNEYIHHGLSPDRVHNFLPESAYSLQMTLPGQSIEAPDDTPIPADAPWRLLFVGRMEAFKGGITLLDSLPFAAARLNKRLHVVFAGDGPDRHQWERHAAQIGGQHPALSCEFAGWVGKDDLDRLYSNTDLLVVPSRWPEPFGRIGPDAGLRDVPAAAFAVGGIPDWLWDGQNGFLAPGDPPTASGLAAAIVKCLESPQVYQSLRRRAREIASRFDITHHVDALETIFGQVRQNANIGPA